jgi:hypothetical protein
MKLKSYELMLPTENETCVFPVMDLNNLYGGTKDCGKPAVIVTTQLPNQKPEARCSYHVAEVLRSSENARDQLLVELLVRALKDEPTRT